MLECPQVGNFVEVNGARYEATAQVRGEEKRRPIIAVIAKAERREPRTLVANPERIPLTAKEREVVTWLEHRTDQEIAEQMGISASTIKKHLDSMFNKPGLSNRHELVDWARVHIYKPQEENDGKK
jgi:DNA-binding CsgD family transcriptional regulator